MERTGKPDGTLIENVRSRLAELTDPVKAESMRAYMKSELPYRGVQRPDLRRLCKQLYAAHPLDDRAVWQATIRALFDGAEYREEWYAAVELIGYRTYQRWQDVAAIPLYEHLIVTGAWWDIVDDLAIRGVGPILRGYSDQVAPILLRWANDEDIWRRRTAILAQIKAKADTDIALLESCIEPSLGEKEFYLRKGIGWALREYGKTDPVWVRAYVHAREDQLSPLSRREALRRLPDQSY